jgi:4-aminobutyrate aminotransferase
MFAFDHLPVPDLRTALPGPRASEFLQRDREFVSGSYTRVYPLVVERGSGAVIVDVDGNRFLDFTAGIAVTNTGHCHPQVVAAIQEQAAALIHMSGTDFYYRPQIELAERLARTAPGPSAKKVFFCNSGAEAIEGALKLARWHTKRSQAIAFLGAFHGRTFGAMSLSASKLVHRRGFTPLVPGIHHVPFPKACAETCSQRGCRLLEEMLETTLRRLASPEEIAAIFVEPIQGEGGYHPLPQACWPALRRFCDQHGVLLVVDEIQSGMGRTGKLYAVEHAGVEPDIICSAKGIASGLPLGAIIARTSVMNWPPGSHASTFGGNPVACRAALATLDLLESEYMRNAATRGEQLQGGLRELSQRHSSLQNVRGIGLMVAVDMPSAEFRERVIQGCFQRGLLLLGCGESAIRFCPPLCITSQHVDIALRILRDVISAN